MPRISFFYGISIYMHFSDHPGPHFHAIYTEYEANIAIASLKSIPGFLPADKYRLVRKWARLHRKELMENWNNAQHRRRLVRIEPLHDSQWNDQD